MPIILEDMSPDNTLQAVVEEDTGVVFFYIWGGRDSSFGVRSCWVRNLLPAPEQAWGKDIPSGKAPPLPRKHCKHPDGAPPLISERLRVVWFEQGDGAALLEGDDILAVIPGWSGQDGFNGFARDCNGTSELCWELEKGNVLSEQVHSALDFWKAWDSSPTPWERVQQSVIESVEKSVGAHKKYFAIDRGEWPPMGLLQISVPGGTAFVTVGVSLRPQPSVDGYVDEPSLYRRIELGMCVGGDLGQAQLNKIGGYVSAQTHFPWSLFTWLGPGHTINCNLFPGFSSVVLTPQPLGAPPVKLASFRGDPVTLLWMIPITEPELRFAMDNSSEALLSQMAEYYPYWIHRTRSSVV